MVQFDKPIHPWSYMHINSTKFTSKHFGMGYVKVHGFHGNPLYDVREWGEGVGPK